MTSGMPVWRARRWQVTQGLGVKDGIPHRGELHGDPRRLLFAKLLCPASESESVNFDNVHFDEKKPANVIGDPRRRVPPLIL